MSERERERKRGRKRERERERERERDGSQGTGLTAPKLNGGIIDLSSMAHAS